MSGSDPDLAVARHETAHAVALYRFELPIGKVSLVADNHFRGFVTSCGDHGQETRRALRSIAIVHLAGPAADELFEQGLDAAADREYARQKLRHLVPTGRQQDLYLCFLMEVARGLVNDNKQLILRFANELISREPKEISGSDTIEILRNLASALPRGTDTAQEAWP